MSFRFYTLLLSWIICTSPLLATGENDLPKELIDPPFFKTNVIWVDSVLRNMSLNDKIAQLIMLEVPAGNEPAAVDRVAELISQYKPGGIIFFRGGPVRQAELTNRFQMLSPVPLLVAMDAEWGLDMRLDSTIKYPYAISLGAIRNNQLVYEMGRQVAEQLKRIGVHMNFAPDADINCNPANPVINSRSFGEDRVNVTLKALAYMLGMQERKVMAVGKHFPGHGDTETDSHFGLPLVAHNRSRLDSIEFFPFRYLVQGGISGMMSAHLHLSDLDTIPGRPSSLSPEILNGILRRDMGFKGLIMTDAMNMKGISTFKSTGSLDVQAILAGNDLLLMPADLGRAIDSIRAAVENGLLSETDIDIRCRRLLLAKAWAGLDDYHPIQIEGIFNDLHKAEYELLNRKMAKELLTLVKNTKEILPLKSLDTLRIASVSIGDSPDSIYNSVLSLYADIDHFFIPGTATDSVFNSCIGHLGIYNLILITLTKSDLRATRKFGLRAPVNNFIDSLARVMPMILGMTANPYSLSLLKNRDSIQAILLAYEDLPAIREMMAQAIFGGLTTTGRLPVSVDSLMHANESLSMARACRLSYALPSELGISIDSLAKIDSLINRAIQEEAFPGCQVLAAKDGKVFYYKAFGYQTYDSLFPVDLNDLYDLASITKIAATLPQVMRLYDQGKIDLKGKLSAYLPDADGTNKAKLQVQDILTHQAGLQAWIPFYTGTMRALGKGKDLLSKKYSEDYPFRVDKGFYLYRQVGLKPGIYQEDSSAIFGLQVASHMWIRNAWRDTIFNRIYASPVSRKKEYLYSDLGFLLLGKMVEAQTGSRLDQLASQSLFAPLGASSLGFNPLRKFDKDKICPTENDLFWRRQLVQGTVHDMGAAMLGGVAGHAGLFSNANDLAKLMQLYLNEGEYGGTRYFKKSTIDLFTSAPFAKNGNRRGLGFDKPLIDTTKGPGSHAVDASAESFGHTGFTGTMVWADPSNGLVYIFLSNRVYPSAENTKLSDMNLRPAIHQILYNAVKSAGPVPF